MAVLRTLWSFVVGVKDALVLLFLLLFFGLLWAGLSMRAPAAPAFASGALLVPLDGTLVDQARSPTRADLLSDQPRMGETQVRDVLRALDAARTDGAVKGVVLDLDRFMGGGPADISAVSAALARVRASGKPVYAYATAYTDSGYALAAQATQAWVDPQGGVLLTGPGGSRLFFKNLLDKLKVDVEVFRVGTFKSAVEPFLLTRSSDAARAADQALLDGVWADWRAGVQRARPKADLAGFLGDPVARLTAAGGDLPKAALTAGLVDRVGDRVAFTRAMREKFGEADDRVPDFRFAHVKLSDYARAKTPAGVGSGVGVLYVAGNIVDGEAEAGTAGGDTIATLIEDALENDDVKALVVRVDSPGGSVAASARIRSALMKARAAGLPVVASFGTVAASGGYYVATAADHIVAQPDTITGSIGVFGVVPTFNRVLTGVGITTETVGTTPLAGQPDLVSGLNAPARAMLQLGVEKTYREFVGLVAGARKLPVAQVEAAAEGRVWTGRDALRLKLIDRFGTLDDAVVEARRRAKLPADARVIPIEAKPSAIAQLLARLGERRGQEAATPWGRAAALARMQGASQLSTVLGMARGPSIQAACLPCMAYAPPRDTPLPPEALALLAR